MSQPIVVKYRWCFEEFDAATRLAAKHSVRPPFRALLHFGAILFIASGVFAISTGRAISSGILGIAFGSYWFAMLAGGRRLLARRRFRWRGDRDSEVEWQVYEGRLAVRTDNSHGEFLWSALAKIVDTPEGFLLYFPGNVYHWIPRHAFEDRASVDAFVERARSGAPKFIERA